jgi:hypothetical protein
LILKREIIKPKIVSVIISKFMIIVLSGTP